MRVPLPWLCLLALLAVALGLDAARPPERQLSARLYLRSVRFYQRQIHPLTGHYIRCRYNPTCSHYSIEAVQRFGIAKGLRLTAERLASCRRTVPMGTYDPVPN